MTPGTIENPAILRLQAELAAPPELRFSRSDRQTNPFAVVHSVAPVRAKSSRSGVGRVGLASLAVLVLLVLVASQTGLVQRAWAFWNPGTDVPVVITPLEYDRISSAYGPRNGRQHRGIDFAAASGTPVRATQGGKILYAGWRGGYGQLVEMEHPGGVLTRYAHCSKILVKEGMTVNQGDVLGEVGSTGRSTGPHLHFEVLEQGRFVNPATYLALDKK